MTFKILPAPDLIRGRLTRPTGPQFQRIPVASRVRPKHGRKRGTVIAQVHIVGGTPRMVAVRWDSTPRWSEAWATDTLVVLDEPLPCERFSTRELIALLVNGCDCPAAPHRSRIRDELRQREGASQR